MNLVSPPDALQPARSLGMRIAAVLLGLASLFASARLLERWAGPSPSSTLERKLAAFAEVKDEVDVVFLGSSLVLRHVDPGRFDEVTTEAGRPTRSYNLGVGGMTALETRHALDRVLALEPAKLRWVFLDQAAMPVDIAAQNAKSPRFVGWHTLGLTWLALKMLHEAEPPELVRAAERKLAEGKPLLPREETAFAWRWRSFTDHVRAAAYRALGLGRLRQLLEAHVGGTQETRAHRAAWSATRTGPAGDGFVPTDWDIEHGGDPEQILRLKWRRYELKQEGEVFLDSVDEAAGQWIAPAELTDAEREFFRGQQQVLEAGGLRPVFITNPDVVKRTARLYGAEAEGLIPVLIELGDVTVDPDLFRLRHRFDWNHLNARGARIYTNRLAERFLAATSASDDGP